MSKLLSGLLFFCIGTVFLKGYSQNSDKLNHSKKQCKIFIERYLVSDTCDYNLCLLLKYTQFEYALNDLSLDISRYQPRYNDNIVPFNFYNSVIGTPNRCGTDSLLKTYSSSSEIEHIMLWGANAGLLNLDENAKILLESCSNASANIRTICHVTISIKWAEGKTSKRDQKFIRPFKKIYIKTLINKLSQMDMVDDDFMEGIVGLICLDAKNKIKPQWITMIIDSQNNDGGWCWDKSKDPTSHPHSTILGYWIILELLRK